MKIKLKIYLTLRVIILTTFCKKILKILRKKYFQIFLAYDTLRPPMSVHKKIQPNPSSRSAGYRQHNNKDYCQYLSVKGFFKLQCSLEKVQILGYQQWAFFKLKKYVMVHQLLWSNNKNIIFTLVSWFLVPRCAISISIIM